MEHSGNIKTAGRGECQLKPFTKNSTNILSKSAVTNIQNKTFNNTDQKEKPQRQISSIYF